MDQKQFETVRDHLRSCNASSLDHDYSLELVAHVETLQQDRAALVALLNQIHEAANRVYQMGDATARNTLVNIYEISGKVAALATK